MIFLVVLLSLIGLIVLHELGHFVLAKKFGVKVEEFGIGFPPRIIGKKFGETLYSLNLLPFGAFVRIYGEQGGIEDCRSFIGKPIWQRVSIVLGGVVSFWIIAAILLSIVAGAWGLPTAVSDEENHALIDPKVQIIAIAPGSPAQEVGLEIGDTIVGFDKLKEVQEFVEAHKGEEITLVIQRGKEVFEKRIIPRVSPPEGEGAVGVGLTRIALKPYSWYQAPVQGFITCGQLTYNIVNGWGLGLKSAVGLTQLPAGMKMEMMGPLGIFDLLREYFALGINYFLFLISLIAVALALINILPIPALDGGKLIFLIIEGIRRRPINYKLEQRITVTSLALLIILIIFVTVKFDIPRVL